MNRPELCRQWLGRTPHLQRYLERESKFESQAASPFRLSLLLARSFQRFSGCTKEPAGGLSKQCPRNRTCRIEFETDASNDYLSRATEPGRLLARGSAQLLSSTLWDGKLTMRFAPSTTASVGDALRISIELLDVSRDKPFMSAFTMEVAPESPPDPPGGKSQPPGAQLLNMPNLTPVRREGWAEYSFNEYSAMRIRSGEDDTLDFFVNMDNLHLKNEIAKRRDRDPKVLEYWFKYGLFLLALGIIYRSRESRHLKAVGDSDEENPDDRAIAEAACEGLAVTVIPTIVQLSDGIPPG